ncbi:TPR repeat-containing thioredoxin TTL1 [Musa troglodytarum]|uniref:TPR repeat-containing thioredoxin TTL1 n=1 Tax=Musa troglodytarum TaxID=320322 RepID=A0A9E7KLM5_9LILI|nr:TPR repeat-containing thioredoxin TTL1 [Musa troglodytarum]
MSRAGETSRPDQKAGSGLAAPGQVEPVADRFQAALRMEENKPDFPDLGSPVSPLRPCPANSSSSSSSSGSYSGKVALPPHSPSDPAARMPAAPDPGRRSHYGELSGEISQRQSGSGLLIFSVGSGCGGSSCTASSPNTNVLPTGNIYPSGKIGKTGMMPRTTPRSDVLGSGTGNYGHGSIMRGGMSGGGAARPSGGASMGNSVDSMTRRATRRMDPQEVTRAGNEHYKRGQYGEALAFYDRAVAMCPENAACRSNRAAALMGLDRLREAVRECEETVRLDPANERAHHRLACLNLRLGLVEDARKHLLLTGQPPDPVELQKTRAVERHLVKCGDTRKIGDWKSALREADAAIAEGADSCPLLIALRAEALLHLQHPDEADSVLSRPSEFEDSLPLSSATKIFVTAAEKARKVDARNIEVTMVMSNVRSVARARAQGNELFKLGNFSEACAAYGEGLSEALRIRPNYTKALLRRADSFSKLECWAECVRDYEVLRKELPWDSEVAEALFHAQVALKTCRGEDVSNLKFGGEVEEVTSIEQFRAAISFPGTSVVYFMVASNPQCTQITPSVDALCNRYPSANFLRVDINRSPDVAKAENVRIVPTFKIYKNGTRVKEMICPSQQVLEYSVRHYSL